MRREMLDADFRDHLQAELVRRCKADPKYSLRTFARALEIQSSFLSKLLSGKRNMTSGTILKLGERLGMSPVQLDQYLGQNVGQNLLKTGLASSGEPAARDLTVDYFHRIADWRHEAILELCGVRDFEPSTKWIARSLGMSVHEAQDALERLVRLEQIEASTGGGLRVVPARKRDRQPTSVIASASRRLHKQMLERALQSLETFPDSDRHESAIALTIDARDLPALRAEIDEFGRGLRRKYRKKNTRDSVYQLGVTFFPLNRRHGRLS